MPISLRAKLAFFNTAVVTIDSLAQYKLGWEYSPLTYALELPEKWLQKQASASLTKETPIPIKMAAVGMGGVGALANELTHHQADTATAAFLDSWEARLGAAIGLAATPGTVLGTIGYTALGTWVGATIDTIRHGHTDMVTATGVLAIPMGTFKTQGLWGDIKDIGATGLNAFWEPTKALAQNLGVTPYVAWSNGLVDALDYASGVITNWIGSDTAALHAAVTSTGGKNIISRLWTSASQGAAVALAGEFWNDLQQHYDVPTALMHGALFGTMIMNGASGGSFALMRPLFTLAISPAIGKLAFTAMDKLPIFKNWSDADQLLVEYVTTAATAATVTTQSFTPLFAIPGVIAGEYAASQKQDAVAIAKTWAGGALVMGATGFVMAGPAGAVVASTAYTMGYFGTMTGANTSIYQRVQALEHGYVPKAWTGFGGDTAIAAIMAAPQLLQSDVRWALLTTVAGAAGGAGLSVWMTTGEAPDNTQTPHYTDTTLHQPTDIPCMPGLECEV